ncbi:FG-GAP repeat domain-containing protein [Cyclobacterium marinum]|uniref:FG-GAP repeat domain-containing protein n=1 Tax=Cyclobacterium marinum TaxID=104 RepID=UPI0011EBC060|nr:VCBS repeat-containing protein [Cyclobacterium marinum]MBI0401407.1 VCBS repeat-containing protein [Cyclobacterium marinum]
MKYFTSILTSAILYLLIIVNVHGQSITFDKPIDVSQGVVSGVSALDVADLNGDALMDVIVLEGGVHAEGRFTLAWFEQTKKGKWIKHDFNIPVKFDDFIGSARCDDMDNDGDMDLVFSNDGHGSGPINVYLLINPGKKKVYNQWEHVLISTINGFHANDMRLADMDQNGKKDVIIRHKNPESLKIIFQNRNEDWQTKTIYEGQAGEGLAVGDINRDGMPDITMTGHWFKAPKDPKNDQFIRFDIEVGFKDVNKATKEEVGDINNDGRPDVLLSPAEHFKKYGGENYDLAWYECPPNPEEVTAWKKHVVKSDYNKAHCAKLADMDNDGDLDIISAVAWDDREIRIYINEGGEFQRSILVAKGKGIYSGAIADMDGDGDLDIVGEDKYATDANPWLFRNLLIK